MLLAYIVISYIIVIVIVIALIFIHDEDIGIKDKDIGIKDKELWFCLIAVVFAPISFICIFALILGILIKEWRIYRQDFAIRVEKIDHEEKHND